MPPYYTAMDRPNYGVKDVTPERGLQAPIVPLYRLGQTVPEVDPSGRYKNVVQAVQAAIRGGAGQIQIMLMQSRQNPIGGAPKGMGPEVRRALREIQLANQVELVGVELPVGAISNMSGWDPQHGVLDERTRQRELTEVQDAIKFTADALQGGSVDIWSQEYPRAMFDAPWNQDVDGKQIFTVPQEEKTADIWFVDTRTGATQRLPREGIPVTKEVDGRIVAERKTFYDFKKDVMELHPEIAHDPAEVKRRAFQEFKNAVFEEQEKVAQAERDRHERHVHEMERVAEQLESQLGMLSEAQKEKAQQEVERYKLHIKHEKEAMAAQESIRKRYEELRENLQPMEEVARQRSIQSYAEAGVMAWEETRNNPHAKAPVTVGPEIGWPQGYGGHPDEFIELITTARQEMQKKLQQQGMSAKEAAKAAKTHIRGTFDTGHMGMWLENFRQDLPYEERLKEFKKWYKQQVRKLVESDTVGSIQAVDSMSAAHAHLPPGSGILPVKEAVQEFLDSGFTGFVVSEGHEEERFGEGRILTKTWEEFNPHLTFGAMGVEGRMAHQGYFSQPYSPRQMFGSYTPPFGEYKPWSEIPFE